MKLNSTNVRKTDTLATQAPNATEAMRAMQRDANAARVGIGAWRDVARRTADPDAGAASASGCKTDADVTGGIKVASLKSEPSFGAHSRWIKNKRRQARAIAFADSAQQLSIPTPPESQGVWWQLGVCQSLSLPQNAALKSRVRAPSISRRSLQGSEMKFAVFGLSRQCTTHPSARGLPA